MPFIRVTRHLDDVVMDININKLISFRVDKGDKYTTLEMVDNLTFSVKDTPRSLRGYIKRAEGTLPEPKEELISAVEPCLG